jgi:ribosomal protein L29
MKKTALTFAALAICLTVTAGIVVDSRASDLKEFSTKDLEKALRETSKELKTFVNLEKKFASAARQSSNSSRKTAINNLQDHMGKCIIRREDDLGQEHTIKMHGGHVVSGTTGAAEVGAPVGTSRAKRSLDYVEGIAGYRLRQLSLMQSLFIAAQQNMQPAIERQGDSLDRYANFIRRFREELERNHLIIEGELGNRAQAKEEAKDY